MAQAPLARVAALPLGREDADRRDLPDNVTSIQLEIEGAGPVTKCFYRTSSGKRTQLGQDLESSFLSTETAGGFQGVTLGMFARLDTPAPITAGANP